MRRALCITWGRRPRPLLLLHSSISPSNMIHRACRPKSWCRSDFPFAVDPLLRPLSSFLPIPCRRNQHQQNQHEHRRRRCPWKSTRSLNGAVRGRTQRCLCAARLVHPGCNGDTLRSDCAGRTCLQNRAGSTSSLSETAKAAVRGIERRCVREAADDKARRHLRHAAYGADASRRDTHASG